MPLFFCLFLGLAVYISTLPGAGAGYRYMSLLDPAGLRDPMVWVYALGQAFFSLSVAGNGTLIYGSYLVPEADVPRLRPDCGPVRHPIARPAGGPGHHSITPLWPPPGRPGPQRPGAPVIFLAQSLPGDAAADRSSLAVFFVSALFAAHDFPSSTSSRPPHRHSPGEAPPEPPGRCGGDRCGGSGRESSPFRGLCPPWMDVCSIYACPVGPVGGRVLLLVWGKADCLAQVNLARGASPWDPGFLPPCEIRILRRDGDRELVMGAVKGGIG
jgi:NSS family neurotransmitter:Na+ symporter